MAKQQTLRQDSAASLLIPYAIDELSIDGSKGAASAEEFSNCVRALAQNWRQGTVGVKTRAMVWKTNKKPWKQKGTGRARAGSARSPLWRGGGIIFGPQPRVRELTINREVRKRAMLSITLAFIANKRVSCLDWGYEYEKPSTAMVYQKLSSAGLAEKRLLFFVRPTDLILRASLANIPFVSVILFDQPNAFHLANSDMWIFLKQDKEQFNEMVKRWI